MLSCRRWWLFCGVVLVGVVAPNGGVGLSGLVSVAAPQPGASCNVVGRERVTGAGTMRCMAARRGGLRWRVVAKPVATTTSATTTTTTTTTSTTSTTSVRAVSTPPRIVSSSVSSDGKDLDVTIADMSPDTGVYAVQWVFSGDDFNAPTTMRVASKTFSIPHLWCSHSYTLRVFGMNASWQTSDDFTNQNATSASAVFEATMPRCTASASAATTTTVPPITYSITYNGNSPTSGSVPTDATAYASNATVTVAGNSGTLARAGYAFGGWCTTQPAAGAACSGTSRAVASTFSITSNSTLYAVWTANTLTVTTDEQSGSAIDNTTTTTGASMSSPGTPTRTGYVFSGWFTASTGGTAITFPHAHGQTANFTLYAQWSLVCVGAAACVVGDTGPGGGIVFYVAGSNFTSTGSDCNTACRYLEAAPAPGGGDVERSWSTNVSSNQTTAVPAPGATATGIGSGMANTNAIQAQTGNVAATSAAVHAYEYSNGGKTDWHLPSKDELNELCKYARTQTTGNTSDTCTSSGTLRSGFKNATYWSSSEYDADNPWGHYFLNGTQGAGLNKSDARYVRPVRAFG